jgi:hypothetical protein
MKSKFYLVIFLSLFISGLAHAQTVVLSNAFDNYNGLPGTVAPGWYYSWNDTAATSKSFYNTSGFYGVAIPAYKFGLDSVTVISPEFASADSLRFWMKGNGSPHDSNTFEIYTSADSISWTLLSSMDSISPSAATITLPLPSGAQYIKFFFLKPTSGYNVGLDDIEVFKNSGVGITEVNHENNISIYPTPTTGLVTVSLPFSQAAEISVYDLLGNRISHQNIAKSADRNISVDLSGQKPGFYFFRIRTENDLVTRRVTLH